jgi:glycosyltransferase involved in cell wall biosynthesis
MRILVSAIACDPYLGSENYFGWSAVQCLAQDHELFVITSHRNRPDLERAEAEGRVPKNVRFFYAGQFKPWHPNRLRARFQSWNEYARFSKEVFFVAKRLQHDTGFDLAHHVTYSTWRVALPLWNLGIPFVFGPVGGYEQFPVRFGSILSPMAKLFEMFRMLSNLASRVSPSVRACIRNAAHVLVANAETEGLVNRLRRNQGGVTRLSPAVYSTDKLRPFVEHSAGKALGGSLRLFAGGMLEGRKGVALALQALAGAKRKGVRFQYRLGGTGPERNHFVRLAAKLGLEKEVCFGETLCGEAYHRELGASHVYLLPSFRESAGLTMMEAMLAGCVPVVANCGGPGHIVTETCGFRIPVTSLPRMVADLEEAIIAIDRRRDLITQFGTAASRRIVEHFSEDNYRRTVNSIYESVTKKSLQVRSKAGVIQNRH